MNNNVKYITVVAGDYPASGHMMLVFVQQLVHALISEGVQVNVVAGQSLVHALIHHEKLLPRFSKAETELGVTYNVYRPYTLSFGNKNPIKRLTKWYNRFVIESCLKNVGGDILYVHFWENALPVYEYALACKKPMFVACGEGDNALEDMVKTMPQKDLLRLASACSGVISVSSENKRKCIEFKLAKENDIGVFPNCVNTEIFHKIDTGKLKKELGINEDDFVISFVGGFIPRKGPDRIAQAVTKLNDPKIKVIFIGKPFEGYEYNFDCPGIIYKGPLDHELIPQYVNCSDVFVMPTQKEGCCNAIVEALAMGIPVISSNRPFNDDILDDKNSIRVDPDNVEAISDAIRILRDDKALRQAMEKYSLSRHSIYTIQGRACKILKFINEQISKINYVKQEKSNCVD